MKKQKIYIFNKTSRASIFGIGTYINQLIDCLKTTNIDFSIIHIFSGEQEASIIEKDGYQQVSIPQINALGSKSNEYYNRNLVYLLKEFIPEEKDTQYIFHLNFMTNSELVINLRKMFKCKIIIVTHYTDWSFSLMGDFKALKTILSKKQKQLDFKEKEIIRYMKHDEKMISKCDKLVCVARHTLDSYAQIFDIDISKTTLINNSPKGG